MLGQDDVFVIPREIAGEPVRELTSKFIENLDEIGDATKVVIPDSVTSIGKFAFAGCNSLRFVEIPNGVKYEDDTFPILCAVAQRRS